MVGSEFSTRIPIGVLQGEILTIRDHLESVYNGPAWVDEFDYSNFKAPGWPTKKRRREETTTGRGGGSNLATPPQ